MRYLAFVSRPVDGSCLSIFDLVGKGIVAEIFKPIFVVPSEVTRDVLFTAFIPAAELVVLVSCRHFN